MGPKLLVLLILSLVVFSGCSQEELDTSASDKSILTEAEISRLEARAESVEIIRDEWGIPHIFGKTDADTVFGTLYAQAEDDFNRIEENYLNAMGRLSEAEGEGELYRDLRMKLFIDPKTLKQQYTESPPWLKRLMDAFADGLNYYLHTHPETIPRVLFHFEPWMALSFSEGSIGGDIERVQLQDLQNFYGPNDLVAQRKSANDNEPRGSNGFAISPKNSSSGNALLLINPHTSFFFRSEVHMVSEEGLNAYGAVTWGQFFVYQGFNEKTGWMHTSSRADAIDEYSEKIIERADGFYYQYGDQELKLQEKIVELKFLKANQLHSRKFNVYFSHHGPIIRSEEDRWVSIKLMQKPVEALTQSYMRTLARSYEDFNETMELRTNSSNNTVFADSDGNIAYYHGNFIPRRDPQFNWNSPLDGSNPLTEWNGLHELDEMITLLNPENGWIQNTNNWPFSAAAEFSPKPEDFPGYMANNSENPRGIHAVRVLENEKSFDLNSLLAAAYDSQLPAFEPLIETLIETAKEEQQSEKINAAINVLSTWDFRFSLESVETSLASFWGDELFRTALPLAASNKINIYDFLNDESAPLMLDALKEAIRLLESSFGHWLVPWGEVNRYQRNNGNIVQQFDDSLPSLPVAFASSRWGSLASFGARAYPGTRRLYGNSGNSFVAAVEFGDRVKARAITVGGLSNNPSSRHFSDQAEMYTRGEFRDVFFYREDIEQNSESSYHPGE
jgi:acyl-homoserine-lactone acylase|tara:strand:+ start:6470 stop:8662 length:2193 start_codon:yes stop_codon:yes gene_type:complete